MWWGDYKVRQASLGVLERPVSKESDNMQKWNSMFYFRETIQCNGRKHLS